jgi:hypothetical protein
MMNWPQQIAYITMKMPLLTELELFFTGQLQRYRAYGACTMSTRKSPYTGSAQWPICISNK